MKRSGLPVFSLNYKIFKFGSPAGYQTLTTYFDPFKSGDSSDYWPMWSKMSVIYVGYINYVRILDLQQLSVTLANIDDTAINVPQMEHED